MGTAVSAGTEPLRIAHLMLPESARRLCAALVLAGWSVRTDLDRDGVLELHAAGDRGFDLRITLVPRLTVTRHRAVYGCQVRIAERPVAARRALEFILTNPAGRS